MKSIKTITVFASAVAALALVESSRAANASSSPSASPTAGREASSAQTRTGKPAAVGEKSALPQADQSFLQKAAEINISEIEVGKIAERASTNPEVKKIAQDMIRNHTAANQQLQKLAAAKGVTLPSAPSKAHQQKIAKLESRPGSTFDKAFIQDQIQNTQQAISVYEREGSRTTDADIKSWAGTMVPRLKDHLATLKTASPEAVGEKNKGMASPSPQMGKPPLKAPVNQ